MNEHIQLLIVKPHACDPAWATQAVGRGTCPVQSHPSLLKRYQVLLTVDTMTQGSVDNPTKKAKRY